jgi:hypothetical protein
MSNNTHSGCPPNKMMNGIITTDYRPNKALYVDVFDNNSFRKFLQRNGNAIRNEQLMKFEKNMRCCACEPQPGVPPIKKFNSAKQCRTVGKY